MRYLTLPLVLLMSFVSIGQDNIKKDPLLSVINSNYYLHNYDIENFYLHTDKSIYFTEENIFFKAYIVNQANNKPSTETTNLHVNLYGVDNKLVYSHLFYAKNGTAKGSIKLPKDLKSGTYTIQLDTQWNRNFKEGSKFTVYIQNLNDTDTKDTIVTSEDNSELEFNISANKEEVIAETLYKSNVFTLVESDPLKPDVVSFKLKTTKEAITSKDNKFVYATLHKKGYLSSTAPFVLSEDFTTYGINFLTSNVFEGLNTVSIFDNNNKLLAEKSFYYKSNKNVDVLANTINQTKDSITLNLNLINVNSNANISLSVLHQESKAINYDSNIINSLVNDNLNLNSTEKLRHYVEDYPSFPYQNISQKVLPFSKENGLTIKGQVNTKLDKPTKHKIILYSNKDNILIESPLNPDKSFEFNNLLLTHPSEYSFTLTNPREKNKIGHYYVYNTFTNYQADSILKNPIHSKHISKYQIKDTLYTYSSNQFIKSLDNIAFPISTEAELLDEVVLEDVRKLKQKKIKAILKENIFLGINNGFADYYLIDEEDDNTTVEQFMRGVKGVEVYSVKGSLILVNRRNKRTTTIAVDGMPVTFNDIAYRNVTDFELISYDKTGLSSSYNEELNLVSRKILTGITNKKLISKIFETTTGFTFNTESIDDSTIVYPSKSSENAFSTIDWIPEVTLNPNTNNIIKIRKPENENVKLIINGVSEDGDLIYKVIDL